MLPGLGGRSEQADALALLRASAMRVTVVPLRALPTGMQCRKPTLSSLSRKVVGISTRISKYSIDTATISNTANDDKVARDTYDKSQITEEPRAVKVLTHSFEDKSFRRRNGLVYLPAVS